MIEGKTIRMGGKDWIVPPLNFRALKRFQKEIGSLNLAELAQSEKVEEIVLAALNRNYPDLTLDELQDMLDMGNVIEVTMAVMGVSGLEARKPGEAAATPQ